MIDLYHPGEIVLLDFPYTDGVRSELRPAAVLMDTGNGDIIIARLTTRNSGDPVNVLVEEWESAGLAYPSFIRPHKLATYLKRRVQRRIGVMSQADWDRVRQAVRDLWQNL